MRSLLATIKEGLTMLSNTANQHESDNTSYSGVVDHLLRPYAANAVIAKASYEIGF